MINIAGGGKYQAKKEQQLHTNLNAMFVVRLKNLIQLLQCRKE